MWKHLLAAAFCAGLLAPALAEEPDHAALREDALTLLEDQFGAFRAAAREMTVASKKLCAGETDLAAFTQAFHDTWLAWAPLDAYQFGPVEQTGAVLRIGFWPDKKDFVGRGLDALLDLPAETLRDPATIAESSAAVQGLPAIERLLASDLDACPVAVGISANISDVADALYEGWFGTGGWSDLARTAGPDNPVYLTDAEFTGTLFTAVDFELSRIIDLRLGRPLGSFDRPMPRRAEAWRAGLSLDIVGAELAGLRRMLDEVFAPNLPGLDTSRVASAFADAAVRLNEIGLPLDEAVQDPMSRLRVEALQTRVADIRLRMAEDVGPALGVEVGFSAADGD